MIVAATAFHWLEYIGLLGGIGSFVVRRVARMHPRIRWAFPPMANFFGAAAFGAFALLLVQPFSWLVLFRGILEVTALVMCRRGLRLVAIPAVLAVFLLPLSSHAAGVGSQFADAIHVLSAAMWAGGIAALLTLRPPGGWASSEATQLLERFGRVAFIAFALTVLTGLLIAGEHLNAISDLWTTAYGIALTLKAAGVVVMAGLSVLWRRGLPVHGVDGVFLAGVVLATALLTVFTPPA